MATKEPTRTEALAEATTRTKDKGLIISPYIGFGAKYEAIVRLNDGITEQIVADDIIKANGVEEVHVQAIRDTGAHRIGLVLNRQLKA